MLVIKDHHFPHDFLTGAPGINNPASIRLDPPGRLGDEIVALETEGTEGAEAAPEAERRDVLRQLMVDLS